MTPHKHAVVALVFAFPTLVGAGPTEFPAIININEVPADAGFGVDGPTRIARLGLSVAGAGDFDGDGVDDFLVGAPGPLPPSPQPYGADHAYVFFGRDGLSLPDDLLFQPVNPNDGVDIPGAHLYASMGESIANAGDVNGDGVDDVIVGSATYYEPGVFGRGYVIFGGAELRSSGVLDVTALDGTNGFVIGGIEGWLGSAVAGVGDMNGDGAVDIAISASSATGPAGEYSGQVAVLFGGAGVGSSGYVDVSTLNGGDGFIINGIAPDDNFGRYLRSAGDVNADGFPDLLISAPYAHRYDPAPDGQVYVIFGGPDVGASGVIDPAGFNGIDGFVMDGIRNDDRLWTIGGVGDVNADGIDDIGLGDRGHCYVVFGRPNLGAGGSFDLTTLDGQNGTRVLWPAALSESSVQFYSGSRCDLNHDGYDDLVVGFPMPIQDIRAQVFVFFGGPGLGAPGTLSPDDLDGRNGFTLRAIGSRWGMGAALAGVGDVNADGVDDLLIGAPVGSVAYDRYYVGRFDVLFGRPKFGDFDRDKDVDMGDFMKFVMCYNGPARPPAGGCPEGVRADFDADGDVDLADYATFSQNYTGAK